MIPTQVFWRTFVKSKRSFILLLLLGIVGTLTGQEKPGPPVEFWAAQLQSPVSQSRLKAYLKLKQMGDQARPILEKLVHSADPEIRITAKELLEHLEWKGIRVKTRRLVQSFPWKDPDLWTEAYEKICQEPDGFIAGTKVLLRALDTHAPDPGATPSVEVMASLFIELFSQELSADRFSLSEPQLERLKKPLFEAAWQSDLESAHQLAFRLAADSTLAPQDLDRSLIEKHPNQVAQLAAYLITRNDETRALAFLHHASQIEGLLSVVWWDLFRSIDSQAELPEKAPLAAPLLRALDREDDKKARQASLFLAADHPVRVRFEQLHGDLKDLRRHQEFSPARPPELQRLALMLIDFFERGTMPELDAPDFNPSHAHWFHDLEALAVFNRFDLIEALTGFPLEDRLDRWIQAQRELGNIEAILQLRERSTELEPAALMELVKVMQQAGQQEEAIHLLTRRAENTSPKAKLLMQRIKKMLCDLGARDQAIRFLRISGREGDPIPPLEIFPLYSDNWQAAHGLTCLLLKSGQHPRDASIFNQVDRLLAGKAKLEQIDSLIKHADTHDDFLGLISAFQAQADPKPLPSRWKLIAQLIDSRSEGLLKTHDEIDSLLLHEARFWAQNKHPDRGLKILNSLLKSQPLAAHYHLASAFILDIKGSGKESDKARRLSQKLRLGDPFQYQRLAACYQEWGLEHEADECLRSLIKLGLIDNPTGVRALRTEGTRAAKRGDFARAARYRRAELLQFVGKAPKFADLGLYGQLGREYSQWKSK